MKEFYFLFFLGWQDVVGVGAVDCSSNFNTPLCREYEVQYYPTIKYFPAKCQPGFLGSQVQQGTVDQLKISIMDLYKKDHDNYIVDMPNLKRFKGSHLKDLWVDIPISVMYTILIVEGRKSYLGTELAFDLVSISNIQTRLAFTSNTDIVKRLKFKDFPGVFLIERANIAREILPTVKNRTSYYNALKDVFKQKGISMADLEIRTAEEYESADVSTIIEMMQVDEKIKEKLHHHWQDDVSFQVDLEGALKYSLFNEIASRKIIKDKALDALKLYINVLAKLFPIGRHGVQFLMGIKDELALKKVLTGEEFEKMARKYERQYEPIFLSKSTGQWLGCRGSQVTYRGFPCSLWMMFHTLSVYAEVNKDLGHSPTEMLDAMKGYVEYFFGCTHCAEHFLKMAESYPGNVSTHEDAMIWLWKAHNLVNHRLKEDATADPKHPKIQFPSRHSCSSCHNADSSWNRAQVVAFLKAMYQNISYLTFEDLTTPSPRKAPSKRDAQAVPDSFNQENNRTMMNFNIFDVSLCVVLYLCSLGIVIYGCMRFYLRRMNKRKYFLPDMFNKV